MSENSVPPDGIIRLADHLFRREAGKLVSYLTGLFGLDHLQLAEDVVQDALVRAMQTWPYYGVPQNPAAWLTQAAKNLALDRLRREKRFREKETAIAATLEIRRSEAGDRAGEESGIPDDRLRLMFACCHPSVPLEAQAALALKTLCGFSPAEIASTFLTTEVAVAKRLTRARQRIREMQLAFEIPSGQALEPRLEGVLQTIYLLFNEGYKASSGNRLIREDLCHEAIRLVTLLVQHPVGNQPRVHALLALFLLNASRLAARVDAVGNIVRLGDQDRRSWDRGMIARGLSHLAQSASGDEASVYHLQAAIAACHAVAADEDSTDWPRILSLYDSLIALDGSPVIALNRAVALARVQGPAAAVEALRALGKKGQLDGYHLFHAVRAELEIAQQNHAAASQHLRRALELAALPSEQAFLHKRLRELS